MQKIQSKFLHQNPPRAHTLLSSVTGNAISIAETQRIPPPKKIHLQWKANFMI